MTKHIAARIDAWLQRCPHPADDPLCGMAEAGLLAPADSYATIARTKAVIVERLGLTGVASVWGGRQMVARWFLAGFGTAEQRAAWGDGSAAVAISEPGVGAHPKRLTTRAEATSDGFRISGEKAWVSNGPMADVFVVLAVTAEAEGRKRYSAFLVPRDTPGLTLTERPELHVLYPSRHCGLCLRDVIVPRSALLGPQDVAFETMAAPFRDIEDAVGAFTCLGAFRFLRGRWLGAGVVEQELASAGALTALIAVFAEAADGVVMALDAGRLEAKAATLAGLHVLAADMVTRIRAGWAGRADPPDAGTERLLRELDVLLSVARGPRLVRLARLAREGGSREGLGAGDQPRSGAG
jgi:acyl-CoA dehydrogenase